MLNIKSLLDITTFGKVYNFDPGKEREECPGYVLKVLNPTLDVML